MHARAERGNDHLERWAAEFMAPKPAPSRLKPVPLTATRAAKAGPTDSSACSQWDRY